MEGTWATRASTNGADRHTHLVNVLLEVDVTGGTLVLTQIAHDQAGRDVATKMAIETDGVDHPIQFGHGLTL
jgi:hypothetical protein